MRLFPNPQDGLHPAFPEEPPPLANSLVLPASVVSGRLGIYAAALGSLFNRQVYGVHLAAGLVTLSEFAVAGQTLHYRDVARRYLALHNIELPRGKIVERLDKLDAENWVAAGGLVGAAVAFRMQRRWSISAISKIIGSFAIGASVGESVYSLRPLRETENAMHRARIRKGIAVKHFPDIQQKLGLSAWDLQMLQYSIKAINGKRPPSQPVDSSPSVHDDGSSTLRLGMASKSEAALSGTFVSDLDKDDPKPQHSISRNGQRIFVSKTNVMYTPSPDQYPELEAHKKALEERRSQLVAETNRVWQLKVEADQLWFTEVRRPKNESYRHKRALDHISNLHESLWTEISHVDWMIDDTKRQMVQLKARSKGEVWKPEFSPRDAAVEPRNINRILTESCESMSKQIKEMEPQVPQILQIITELQSTLPPGLTQIGLQRSPQWAQLERLIVWVALYEDLKLFVAFNRSLERHFNGQNQSVSDLMDFKDGSILRKVLSNSI